MTVGSNTGSNIPVPLVGSTIGQVWHQAATRKRGEGGEGRGGEGRGERRGGRGGEERGGEGESEVNFTRNTAPGCALGTQPVKVDECTPAVQCALTVHSHQLPVTRIHSMCTVYRYLGT